MTKDEAEAIHTLARQLLEDDVSCETRCRLARKIIEHARTIKASCMAEPQFKLLPRQGPITITLPKFHSGGPVALGSVDQENDGHELFLSACRVPAGWVPSDEPEQGKSAADCMQRNPWQLSPQVMAKLERPPALTNPRFILKPEQARHG